MEPSGSGWPTLAVCGCPPFRMDAVAGPTAAAVFTGSPIFLPGGATGWNLTVAWSPGSRSALPPERRLISTWTGGGHDRYPVRLGCPRQTAGDYRRPAVRRRVGRHRLGR